MCAIEVILPAMIVDRVVDKLCSYIAKVTRADFTRHILTGELILHNGLIACVAVRHSVAIPHFNCMLFHACHTINYTRRVYYMLQVNVVHANTYRNLVCSCRVTMRVQNEVTIELYRRCLTTFWWHNAQSTEVLK